MKRYDLAVDLDQLVDRVDGGAGDVVDHHPLRPGDLVQQAGLADVRLADDRHPARSAFDRVAGSSGPPGAPPGWRPAGHRCPARAGRRPGTAHPARGSTWWRPRLRCAGRRPCWPPAPPACGCAAAPGPPPRRRPGCRPWRRPRRAPRRRRRWPARPARRSGRAMPLRVRGPAAGVDHHELPAVPVRVVGDPVPGHSGHVLDHGLAAADDPVDQRRLADVGAADDGDDGQGQRRCGRDVSHVQSYFAWRDRLGLRRPGQG